jgi:hypothetical protein
VTYQHPKRKEAYLIAWTTSPLASDHTLQLRTAELLDLWDTDILTRVIRWFARISWRVFAAVAYAGTPRADDIRERVTR